MGPAKRLFAAVMSLSRRAGAKRIAPSLRREAESTAAPRVASRGKGGGEVKDFREGDAEDGPEDSDFKRDGLSPA